jgi:hypothetical protein
MSDPREMHVSRFLHQIDSIGLYQSVCSVCFQTVAKEPRESKLIAAEERHQCGGMLRALVSH